MLRNGRILFKLGNHELENRNREMLRSLVSFILKKQNQSIYFEAPQKVPDLADRGRF